MLADVSVPACLLLEVFPNLSAAALRLYLYLLTLEQLTDEPYEEAAAQRASGLSASDLQQARRELQGRGLLETRQLNTAGRQTEELILPDPKPRYWEQEQLRQRQAASVSPADSPVRTAETAETAETAGIAGTAETAGTAGTAESAAPEAPERLRAQAEQREAIIRQINGTFYQGVMPLPFYQAIEDWYRQYHFADEVVYALFGELQRYAQLPNVRYAEKVAANWASHGIQTFADLSHFAESHSALQVLAEKVRQKLHLYQALNSYQLEMLRRWSEDWGFDFPLIEEALRRASRRGPVQFPYVDRILEDWHQAGCQTLEDVQRWEAQREQSRYAATSGNAGGNGGGALPSCCAGEAGRAGSCYVPKRGTAAMGNFAQRSYAPESLERYGRSLDFLEKEAARPVNPVPSSASPPPEREGS